MDFHGLGLGYRIKQVPVLSQLNCMLVSCIHTCLNVCKNVLYVYLYLYTYTFVSFSLSLSYVIPGQQNMAAYKTKKKIGLHFLLWNAGPCSS